MSGYDFYLSNQKSIVGEKIGNEVVRLLGATKKRFFPGRARILEIGPGRGDLARHFINDGNDYTCYDNNEGIVRHVATLGASAKQGNVPPIPEAPGSFDLVIASNVFEHCLDHRAALHFLEEARRVLRENGRIILFNPNFIGWGKDFYDIDYTHSYPVTPSRAVLLFQDAGFHLDMMKNIYGFLPSFPGWWIDAANSAWWGFVALFFPLRRAVLKARVAFHANLLIVGKKPGNP